VRVESIDLRFVRIPFKRPFGHALKRRTEAETILVVARSAAGTIGLGEIVPRPYLTGETIEGVLASTGPARAARCRGRSFSTRGELTGWLREELEGAGRDLATLGGFELALLDLAGKELGFHAGEVLGGGAPGPELPAGVVIGFEVETPALRKHGVLLRMTGKTHVKVKVGRADDLERLEILSGALGAALPLRLDANGAWPVDVAIERLTQMRARFNVESIEQPIADGDPAGLRRIRRETGVKVMADESLCTLDDGRRLIDAEAVDIFNIRVGKCGGLLGALRLVELARAAGLGLHLGALVGETAVLSRAAEIFGRRVAGFACLEGKGQNRFLLAGDIAVELRGGDVDGGDSVPGLGVELQEDQLRKYEQTARAAQERGASSS
jgi:L-alanine-DL-glutamate epimerase-like enolase superfamily enzyme